MSREIKFRAWNYVQKVMLGAISIEHLLTEPPLSKNGVDELIIMQYTGLKDENGVEIYEGDIVSMLTEGGEFCPRTTLGSIEYVDGAFVLTDKRYYGTFYHYLVSSSKWNGGNCSGTQTHTYKVIGNIYQNKELLDDV